MRLGDTPTLNQVIEEITSFKKINFFFGAGVSRASMIPTVYDTYIHLSEVLCLGNTDDQKYLLERLHQHKIPFESIIEALIDISHEEGFLAMYDEGKPNIFHHFVAHLIHDNKTERAVTTNFDCLLEQALDSLDTDYELYFNEEQFASDTPSNQKKKIIKLHGTAEHGETGRNSIRVTLRTLTARDLTNERTKEIARIFEHKDDECLLIFGYSFSDVFDINPSIEAIDGRLQNTYVVDHRNEGVLISSVKNKSGNNPFALKEIDGYEIKAPTELFIRKLWDKLISVSQPFEEQKKKALQDIANAPFDWKRYFSEVWLKDRTIAQKYLVTAAFWNYIEEYEKALQYLDKASNVIGTDDLLYYDILLQKGLALQKAAMDAAAWMQSLKYYEDGLLRLKERIKVAPDDRKLNMLLSQLLYQTGRIYEDNLSAPDVALDHYLQCYEIDVRLKDYKGASKVLHQTATIRGRNFNDHDEAIKLFKESIALKEKIGYIEGVARSLYEIAVMYHYKLDPKNAIEYLEKAQQLSDQFGNKELMRSIFQLKGVIYTNLQMYEEGLEAYKSKLALFLPNEYTLSHYLIYYSIANVLHILDRYDEAHKNLDKAIKGYERLDNRQHLHNAILLRALIMIREGQYDGAKDILEGFIQPSTEYTDLIRATAHYYLAVLTFNLGDIEQAKELSQTAKQLYLKINENVMLNGLEHFISENNLA
ncbi:MAG: SIR2 family protein [Bacteroidetes bacterium]|nr:SIR2 family protein [Bacteroidota bacterium]